ncbi:hypothetical protein [Lacihabitans soyangensis]|uniref:Uncharacterized protein n=1 Tax=Lacihabitans soyangensis TaxID=869394 RepID=A0AAE3GYJ5_9BACT|nr:hypothetical protein [Lacihabitans soyangensis]MCP9761397.1 hypothetical protein [Lacihabitans soyangensis]
MRNERYDFLHLPQEFHKPHKSCEFLLYQIEDFVTADTFKDLKVQTIQFDKEVELIDGEHILDYLLRNNKSDKHDEIITSNILNAVIADTCQFLQIALFASLQQRLTVTFSLLRKPFVYNLLVILRLYLTSDFLDRFNKEDSFDTTGLSQENIIELLNASESLLFTKSIKALDVYDFIFNPALSDSLVNMSNKALHPSTTRNKNNKTEIQNINFVFSTKDSIMTQWDYLYRRLPFLLLYLNEILELIMFDHLKLDSKTYTERLTERANFFTQNNAC